MNLWLTRLETVQQILVPPNLLSVQKYNAEKTATKDVATAQLQKCLAGLPATNGVFFHIKASFN